ncbi:hypothetical protein RRG08_004164 [Elysia crispata]|uniref:Secreted protein n=1 Tax=Elysia crispata TaxID=231223 RepID=A0AAE0YWD9_9GAST|nr:hypothetical protein RRG08_004164 [Elysia crispata]
MQEFSLRGGSWLALTVTVMVLCEARKRSELCYTQMLPVACSAVPHSTHASRSRNALLWRHAMLLSVGLPPTHPHFPTPPRPLPPPRSSSRFCGRDPNDPSHRSGDCISLLALVYHHNLHSRDSVMISCRLWTISAFRN